MYVYMYVYRCRYMNKHRSRPFPRLKSNCSDSSSYQLHDAHCLIIRSSYMSYVHMYAHVFMYFMCTRIRRSFKLHDAPLHDPVHTYVHARICTYMYVHIGMYGHICAHTCWSFRLRSAPLHHFFGSLSCACCLCASGTYTDRTGIWATSKNASKENL